MRSGQKESTMQGHFRLVLPDWVRRVSRRKQTCTHNFQWWPSCKEPCKWEVDGEIGTLNINRMITASYSSTLRCLQHDGKHCPPRLRKQLKWRDLSSLNWAVTCSFYNKHKFWLFRIPSRCGYTPPHSNCSVGTANPHPPLQLQDDPSEHFICLSSHSDRTRGRHMTWAKSVSLHWDFSAKAVWEDGFLLQEWMWSHGV